MTAHIKEILPHILKTDNGWQKKLLIEWPTIIGSLKDKVILEKIESETVVLKVVHPAWIQELSFLKQVLIQTINNHLDQPHIKHIKIKTGALCKKKTLHVAPIITHNVTDYTLSSQENNTLNTIKDTELKTAIKLFLQRCVNQQ